MSWPPPRLRPQLVVLRDDLEELRHQHAQLLTLLTALRRSLHQRSERER